jgi:anti-sigma regulatory factor (Ser/Thr protein kinase)
MNTRQQKRDAGELWGAGQFSNGGGEPPNTLVIRLSSDPKLLKVVRAGIAHLCDLAGFPEEHRRRAILAVDEACTNIIMHAYGGASDKPIVVTARLIENGIEVVLRDYGKRADPEVIKSRELDDIRPGGLGVHLIRSAMDSVVYDNSLPDGNQLTLKKFLPQPKSDSSEEVR